MTLGSLTIAAATCAATLSPSLSSNALTCTSMPRARASAAASSTVLSIGRPTIACGVLSGAGNAIEKRTFVRQYDARVAGMSTYRRLMRRDLLDVCALIFIADIVVGVQ